MSNVTDLNKFYGSQFYCELDLTKACYQIPFAENARPLTAFPIQRGLMESCRLIFGLVAVYATYIRFKRRVLAGLMSIVLLRHLHL